MTAAPSPVSKLRYVVILCAHFGRNLAYYRAGQTEVAKAFYKSGHPASDFYCQANANFFDICILEWCKLFAEKKGKHRWQHVVADEAAFKASLLAALGLDDGGFQQEINRMRLYRDKFVAHLDEDDVMRLPLLSVAHTAVQHLHSHLVTVVAKPNELAGLTSTPEMFAGGYSACRNEAEVALAKAMAAATSSPVP